MFFFFSMMRRPPRSTLTDTVVPDPTLFRSLQSANAPRLLATENVLLDPVDGAADQRTELVDRGAEAAAPVELIKQPAGLELLGQCGQHVAAFGASLELLGNRLGREHAGLHRRVVALDLGEVQITRKIGRAHV